MTLCIIYELCHEERYIILRLNPTITHIFKAYSEINQKNTNSNAVEAYLQFKTSPALEYPILLTTTMLSLSSLSLIRETSIFLTSPVNP
jgi:hypothetical protein